MAFVRTASGGLLACLALVVSPAASAQLAPGLRAPETKLDAISQAHSMSCFLAVAARPVPGLNLDMPDNMGEGHFVEESAPEWLSQSFEFESETNFSRAASDEGDIWIAFETESRTCTIATDAVDPATLQTAFENKAFASDDWKYKKSKSGQPAYHQMKLGGLTYRSEFPSMPADSSIFAVRLTAK